MAALGRRFVVSETLPTCAWSSFLQASSAAREEPESPSTDPQPKQARDLPVARASEIPTGAEPAPRALTRAASPSYVAIRRSPADGPDTHRQATTRSGAPEPAWVPPTYVSIRLSM